LPVNAAISSSAAPAAVSAAVAAAVAAAAVASAVVSLVVRSLTWEVRDWVVLSDAVRDAAFACRWVEAALSWSWRERMAFSAVKRAAGEGGREGGREGWRGGREGGEGGRVSG